MRLMRPTEIPAQLLELPQPPKQLYIEGTMPEPHLTYLTVVGSRNHTSYGRDACTHLIEGLAGYPIVIVSGLALGIDTIAHESALRVGLTTIAFPGSGLSPKALAPRQNVPLAQKILNAGGALISELDPHTLSAQWTFPRRNRLMAGLARATLLIEAAEQSGTLITARLATEYNRDVLAVPGSIFSDPSSGTNMLLRMGATPIRKPEDILEALGFEVSDSQELREKKLEALSDCTPEEKELLKLLSEPVERDELCRQLSKPAHVVGMLLSILEMKGLIKEEYGQIRRS